MNLLLVGLIVFAATKIRQQYLEEIAREQAVLGKRVSPAPPPPLSKLPAPQPVSAAGYVEIAEKMLFSKDRNPTVEVEAPPPPAPVPPLPVFHGVMGFPDGPTVILSEKGSTQHRGVHIGEKIGEFVLAGINQQEISLEWDGQVITKPLSELLERSAVPAPAKQSEARSAGGAQSGAKPAQPTPRGQAAPGADARDGVKICQPGDTSPPGTVVDGMKKVVTQTPFGSSCRWEPI